MANMVKRIYGGFRGVDFRGEEINLNRSPDALNVWKDYKEVDSIRTRPGITQKEAFADRVYGIHYYNKTMIVHSGTNLYRNGVVLYSGVAERKSESFVYNGVWYFKDGENYLQYDGTTIKAVEGYVPTTTIARKPLGGGTLYEDVNMLTGYRKNSFLADGESKVYHLDTPDIDTGYAPRAWVNGTEVTGFTVNYGEGKITFQEAPAAPLTDGQDNVVIQFRKNNNRHAPKILNCTLLQVFDNRVFVSGNPNFPNTIYHCSLSDPTYFSDLDYYDEGLDSAAIRGLVAGNNALWVFREPSDANTTVFYHAPTLDSDYGKIYPSQHSSVTTGCVGRAVNFNDDIVFFSERGMEGISGDITTEQVLGHRSSLVDRKMITEPGYKDMVLAEWEGYLLVFIGTKVYLADSRTAFNNQGHMEYEWFYWEIGKEVHCARTENGVLYIGTDDGVYRFTPNEGDVESYWTTPKDKYGNQNKQKTTNKRGCVVEATGDISVSAKLEDTDFEPIGAYSGVTDYFVCRIKRKKFKDLQLRFATETRFSLETASMEVFVGGYIKR